MLHHVELAHHKENIERHKSKADGEKRKATVDSTVCFNSEAELDCCISYQVDGVKSFVLESLEERFLKVKCRS